MVDVSVTTTTVPLNTRLSVCLTNTLVVITHRFTDIFEEGWMRSEPFQNNFGLMTKQGVPKPAWRAFQLLATAGNRRLPVLGAAPSSPLSNVSVPATISSSTAGDSATVQLFVANWRPRSKRELPCDAAEGEYAPDNEVSIILQHRNSSSVESLGSISNSTIARIDSEHTNPKALWLEWGQPKYLTASQIGRLKHASEIVEAPLQVRSINASASIVSFRLSQGSATRILLQFRHPTAVQV
eukprot:SAG22_NODE_358_length_11759_cov_39.384563_5_plen_240_part_00